MDKTGEYKIYQEAIEFFGNTSQKIMVIEEMSELTKELCKELRDRGNVVKILQMNWLMWKLLWRN